MNSYSDILRYMGHKGEADSKLEILVSSCLEKLASVNAPRHIMLQLPCTVKDDTVTIDLLIIKSHGLAARLNNCTQVYILAATLGAAVDRLIAQRTKIDSTEALCLQACAAVQIEDYCNSIEQKLRLESKQHGFFIHPRFSPGYCDFDITHQTDLLNILQAYKHIGVSETKSHMLTPLKTVTAIIGRSTGDV